MREAVTLNQDEQRRLLVLNEVIRGRLTTGRAGEAQTRTSPDPHTGISRAPNAS